MSQLGGAMSLLVLMYSARTVQRNFDWRNEETLFGSGVSGSPLLLTALSRHEQLLSTLPSLAKNSYCVNVTRLQAQVVLSL